MNKEQLEQHLEKLVWIYETAKTAVSVNENAIQDKNMGYPYAAGYSRSALQLIKDELEIILDKLHD